MDVSVIIINYNTRQMTAECIDSVFEKTKDIKFEIILVDNASTDGSKEFFEQDKRIIYIYNNENLGFGRANNIGIEVAKGRNILFLNSDTLLINNAIKILSNYLDENPKVGACGGNLYTKDLKPNHSYRLIFPSIMDEINTLFAKLPSKFIYGKNEEYNHTNKPLLVKYITGADLMVRKNVLDDVGLFDPRFFMYFEETELCHRFWENKYAIMSIPNAKIIHLDGGSFNSTDVVLSYKKRDKMYDDSKYKFYKKLHSVVYVYVIKSIELTCIYSRIFFYSILNSPKKFFWITKLKSIKEIL